MDGSGKTTQMHRLAARLRAHGTHRARNRRAGRHAHRPRRFAAFCSIPPIRSSALPPSCCSISPPARRMSTSGSARPSQRGEIVLADRFTDSSLVYQGYGRGLGAETVAGARPHRLPRPQAAISPSWWISTPKPAWRARAPATPPSRTAKRAWTSNRIEFHRTRLRGLSRAGRSASRSASKWSTAARAIDEIEQRGLGDGEPAYV